jgi:hypothetical protein
MLSFRELTKEVYEPFPEDEKEFKDKHVVDIVKHPVNDTETLKGTKKSPIKKKRLADYDNGKDEEVYEEMTTCEKCGKDYDDDDDEHECAVKEEIDVDTLQARYGTRWRAVAFAVEASRTAIKKGDTVRLKKEFTDSPEEAKMDYVVIELRGPRVLIAPKTWAKNQIRPQEAVEMNMIYKPGLKEAASMPFGNSKKAGPHKDKFGNVIKDKNVPKHLAKKAMKDADDTPFAGAKKAGPHKDRFGNVIKDKNVPKYLAKKAMKNEDIDLDEAKSATGYDLYHKDFSSAMQHAYAHAKKKHGITIDPNEIDDKVATGPRKPSEGKTNTYRLKGDKGAIQVQVYNKGGSKPFELNMYKEEVDLEEISTKTLRSYSKKAKKELDQYGDEGDWGLDNLNPEDERHRTKRYMGYATADYKRAERARAKRKGVKEDNDLDEAWKVGETVKYFGRQVKITKVYPNGGYQIDGKTNVSGNQLTTNSTMKNEDVNLDEAKMENSEVLAAAKQLASRGKNPKTKEFGQGLVDFYNKNDSFTPDQVAGLQNIMKNASFQFAKESTDLDEALPAHLAKLVGKDGDWTPEVKKRLGKDGVKRSADSLKRKSNIGARAKDVTPKGYGPNEEFELDEAFKAGAMSLKDGSTVKLTNEDAKALDSLYDNLNSGNRKKMQEKLEGSKKAFTEILAFAKQAV